MDEPGGADAACAGFSARLAALLDDELPLPERYQVEQHLQTCARCAEDLEMTRAARALLRETATRIETPPYLRQQVQAKLVAAARQRSPSWRVVAFAAMAAALVVLAAFGFGAFVAPRIADEALFQRVALAHQQETLSAQPVAFASNDATAVRAWLRQQDGKPVDVPSLDSAGFQLVGARLDTTIAPQAATLVYQGPDGLLSCVVLPSASPPRWLPSPSAARHPGLQAVSVAQLQLAAWTTADGTYVMAGDFPPAELALLAQTALTSDSD